MKPLLALKLKRELLALNPALAVELKNVSVNGAKFGCTGFVTDPATGRIVYVNTDHNHGTNGTRALYRTAKHTRDYTGGVNRRAEYGELAGAVVELLGKPGVE